jgi:hypothetical protein
MVNDGTREHGMRAECIRMRPHDHIGWVVDGSAGFDAVAAPFLAEGAARGELLIYVAADPDAATPARLGPAVASHGVRVASIAEVYGSSGIVEASAQRATFAGMLGQALADGYAGIRVAADNTPLITDEDRFAAWVRWELTADQFMAANPVTGLCAFDQRQTDVGRLRHLATLHPLSSADSPRPQYRLFADDGYLRVVGQIDSFAAQQVRLALDDLPRGTSVLVDVPAAGLASRTVTVALRQLREAGIPVTVRSANDAAALPATAATPQ